MIMTDITDLIDTAYAEFKDTVREIRGYDAEAKEADYNARVTFIDRVTSGSVHDYCPNPLFLMNEQHKGILDAVRSGNVNGRPFKMVGGIPRPGESYIAERNTGLRVLTCERVDDGPGQGWIINKEGAYPYNIGECIRIEYLD